MASNAFGNLFRITTWGESHGRAIGVVIDGCPAGIEISDQEITLALQARAPGRSPHTSPRSERDEAEILSGVFEGKTTGAPICIMIPNMDKDSSAYEPIKDVLRPGHANFTYLEKYGIFDFMGGGRSSARETACRVAAGAIARKFVESSDIHVVAYVKQIGSIEASCDTSDVDRLRLLTSKSPLFCPDEGASELMASLIASVQHEGDSIGGMVEFCTSFVSTGLGDPVYEKLDARLAYALMGLPGAKAVELGSGVRSVAMRGSEHNDLFINERGAVRTETNNAGGVLGGISTGMPIVGRVSFKPASSISKPMKTLTTAGTPTVLELPAGSRHDPCIAIRAVPVVEAMVVLVLADALLMNRCVR